MISVKELNDILKENFNITDINGRDGFSFTVDEVVKLKNILTQKLLSSIYENTEPLAYIDSLTASYPSCIKKLSFQSPLEKSLNKTWFPVFAATADVSDVINDLRKDNDYLQSKIDDLMLEYCPDEMTDEQLKNWESHQKAVDF